MVNSGMDRFQYQTGFGVAFSIIALRFRIHNMIWRATCHLLPFVRRTLRKKHLSLCLPLIYCTHRTQPPNQVLEQKKSATQDNS